jgi:phosphoserine phosphatase RsbU/P
MLEAALQKQGYEVVAVEDGYGALKALEAEDAPRLAVIDWLMPGLNGVEVCRRVREKDRMPHPHIIVLTALDTKEHAVEALASGASDFITKPFDMGELHARLRVGEQMLELRGALEARVTELQTSLDRVKTLQGLLPICVHCHKVRNDDETWQDLDQYLKQHSDVQVSHGVCPECKDRCYSKEELARQAGEVE